METAFLKAIIENPTDDAPRLIYADWLEERGDAEQAEFIRLQCARRVWHIPHLREMELLDRHWQTWAQPILHILPRLSKEDIYFARGFPFRLVFRNADDMEHLPALVQIAPLREMDLVFDGKARPNRQWYCNVLFTDSDPSTGKPVQNVRQLRIRSEEEIKHWDTEFQAHQ